MASGRGGLGRTSPAAKVELPCGGARANDLEEVRKDQHSLDLPARSGGLSLCDRTTKLRGYLSTKPGQVLS